jgi:hypothetical protein
MAQRLGDTFVELGGGAMCFLFYDVYARAKADRSPSYRVDSKMRP